MGIREESIYEGGPHIGDLILNVLLGFTVVCLPLTVGAIARAIWLRYMITKSPHFGDWRMVGARSL